MEFGYSREYSRGYSREYSLPNSDICVDQSTVWTEIACFRIAMNFEHIDFMHVAAPIIKQTTNRRYRAHFGISPRTTAETFLYLSDSSFAPHHFLWTLYFLKVYPTLDIASTVLEVAPETFMRNVILGLHLIIEDLPSVSSWALS